MKNQLLINNKFKTTNMILNQHSSVFADKPHMQAMRAEFTAKTDRIALLLDELAKPYTILTNSMRDKAERLHAKLGQTINMGIAFAASTQNTELMRNLNNYRQEYLKRSKFRLPGLSFNVYNELQPYQEQITAAGLKAAHLADLSTLNSAYTTDLQQSNMLTSTRRASRSEVKQLISECREILRKHLDFFAKNYAEDYPEFYREYAAVRNLNKPRRRRTKTGKEIADVTGTVINASTQAPVAMAILSLPDLGLMTETDEDGCYAFDELPAGTYSLSCHAPGYEVPAKANLVIAEGESLVHNISLQPLAAS